MYRLERTSSTIIAACKKIRHQGIYFGRKDAIIRFDVRYFGTGRLPVKEKDGKTNDLPRNQNQPTPTPPTKTSISNQDLDLKKNSILMSKEKVAELLEKAKTHHFSLSSNEFVQFLQQLYLHGYRVRKDPAVKRVLTRTLLQFDSTGSRNKASLLKDEHLLPFLEESGNLGLSAQHLNEQEYQGLQQLLIRLSSDKFMWSNFTAPFSRLFIALAALKVDLATIPSPLKKKLFASLQLELLNPDYPLDPAGIIKLFDAFAELKIRKNDGLSPQAAVVCLNLSRNALDSKNVTILQVYTLLSKLRRFGFTSEEINQHQLFPSVLQALFPSGDSKEMNSEDVLLLVKALSTYSFSHHLLPYASQERFTAAVINVLPQLRIQALASLLSAFSAIQYKWNDMPLQVKNSLLLSIKANTDETLLTKNWTSYYPRDVSIVVIALSELGLSNEDIPLDIQSRLLAVVEKCCPYFTAVALTTILQGLGKIGFRWNLFSDSLQSNLEQQLLLVFSVQRKKESSTNSPGSKEFNHSTKDVSGISLFDIKWFLNGAALLQYRYWLPGRQKDSLKEKIFQHLIQIFQDQSKLESEEVQQIPQLVHLLGGYNMFWQSLPIAASQTILKLIEIYASTSTADGKDVSNFLLGLVRLEFSWSDLSIKQRSDLIGMIATVTPRLAAQALTNVMYCLTLLTFDVEILQNKDLHRLLLLRYKQLVQEMTQFDPEALSQLSIYFEWLRTQPQTILVDVGDLPKVLSSALAVSSKMHLSFWNKLKNELEKDVKTKGLEIENEFQGIPGGIFPIDIAIKDRNHLVALIELDSADYHKTFTTDTGKVILGRDDQLKEYLYHFYYPQVPLLRVSLKAENIINEVHNVRNQVARIIGGSSSSL